MKHVVSSPFLNGRPATSILLGIGLGLVLGALVANAQVSGTRAADDSEQRPYDDKLTRLSEVLGALHYLRELCGANEGQLWRDRMRELITTDNGSALRKVRLTKSFNQGYRSYRRSFQSCTQQAQLTATRFISEGASLSDALVRETP